MPERSNGSQVQDEAKLLMLEAGAKSPRHFLYRHLAHFVRLENFGRAQTQKNAHTKLE